METQSTRVGCTDTLSQRDAWKNKSDNCHNPLHEALGIFMDLARFRTSVRCLAEIGTSVSEPNFRSFLNPRMFSGRYRSRERRIRHTPCRYGYPPTTGEKVIPSRPGHCDQMQIHEPYPIILVRLAFHPVRRAFTGCFLDFPQPSTNPGSAQVKDDFRESALVRVSKMGVNSRT